MKKWLYLAAALTAVGIFSRLPHPARDISELKPVRAVYLYMDDGKLNIETDTGDRGAGSTLREAAEDMKEGADGEIFLDTAEFLLLSPEVPITEEYYTLLRPDCRVAYTETAPHLKTVSDFLSIHKPKTTLAHCRASTTQTSALTGKDPTCVTTPNSIPSGSWPPCLRPWPISPAPAGSWRVWPQWRSFR